MACELDDDDEKLLGVDVSGGIARTRGALDRSEPMPKKLVTMSSSAIVAPGSTWIVVDEPDCEASVRVSVKLSWYFIACALVLAMRMSDSKSEAFAPVA